MNRKFAAIQYVQQNHQDSIFSWDYPFKNWIFIWFVSFSNKSFRCAFLLFFLDIIGIIALKSKLFIC
jgi:hypothetical protein